MSDDQTASSGDEGHGSDSGDGTDPTGDSTSSDLEPGGGPERVVSNKSVDDILSSLDETSGGAATKSEGDGDATLTESATDADTSTEDATGSDTSSERAVDADTDTESTADTDTNTATGTDTDTDADDDSTAVADSPEDAATAAVTTTFDEDEIPDVSSMSSEGSASNPNAASEPEPAPEPNAAPEPANATVESGPDVEDLTARIERGEITGADVRSAEAGEGRESTPGIDEVELSLDDLETGGETAATGSEGEAGDDAGPLAGSIPGGDGTGASDTATESEDDDQPGLLDRLKRFFS